MSYIMVMFLGTLIAYNSSDNLNLCCMKPCTGSCQACPENGLCYAGELQCLPGFKKHGRVCLKDQQAHKAAKAVVSLNMGTIYFPPFSSCCTQFRGMCLQSYPTKLCTVIFSGTLSFLFVYYKHMVSRKCSKYVRYVFYFLRRIMYCSMYVVSSNFHTASGVGMNGFASTLDLA